MRQNSEIEELDLNPIFVSPHGVQIADARIVLASARAVGAGEASAG